MKQKSERKENKAWEEEFNKITSLRKQAQKLEKQGELEKAIESYKKSIQIGENSDRLNYSNFAFDIQRVIIILSKTKEFKSLKEFLKNQIVKYPNAKEVESWKIRLNKISK